MLHANRSRTLLSLVAVALAMTLPWTASAAPDLTLALQPPPDPMAPPVDTAAAPPADQQPTPAPSPLGGLKIDGNGASLKLGFLFQPSYELASGSTTGTQTVQHFFVRRMRLMAGLTLGSQFEFFADTDSPNIGRGVNVAPSSGMAIQDAFMTWKPMDEFKLDGGMMLIPFSHNSVQGATTLYAWDYFASSFNQNAGFGNSAGRDVGVQARGLVIGHLEYRLGVFTGYRGAPLPGATTSRAEMRVAARVQYNLFDPETAFFYAGTYAGTKKVVSFGASVDHQDNYTAFDVDAFVDLPVGADVLTAQAAFLHYANSAPTFIAVPDQNDIVFEAGYRLSALKISPIVRFEDQLFDAAAPGGGSSSVLRISAGVAWWPMGHNLNVKLFYTYVKPPAPFDAFNQLNLQVQLYVF
jgi:hypothetical protein